MSIRRHFRLLFFAFVLYRPKVELLHFLSRPGSLSQEGQARLDARIAVEAVDPDLLGQAFPFIDADKIGEHCFERRPMKRIVGLRVHAIA